VAAWVAAEVGAPLDVFVVRKLGVPGHRELAMGAVASGGVRVINDQVVGGMAILPETIDEVAAAEATELQRREARYRAGRAPLRLAGAAVLLVDDGLATGSTMRAAIEAARRHGPAEVVVAVPVGSRATCLELSEPADRVVCLATPEPFLAVGHWYDDFSQTTDEEITRLLAANS
jgi:predicted phosphoribosyltransferase